MNELSYIKRPEWAGETEPFIRLSHSTLETLYQCDRKFEIEKLLTMGAPQEDSEHFSFGHAYGSFVQTYLLTESFDISLLEGWLEYWPIVEIGNKNQDVYTELCFRTKATLDALLEEWELAFFTPPGGSEEVPAVELPFRINIDDTFFYVGYMDVVLRNKSTGKYAVMDVKTTGLQLEDIAPLYKFSGQVLGYSIALDAIASEEQGDYHTMYLSGRIGRMPYGESTRPELFSFSKTIVDRLQWFLTLLQEVRRIHTSIELGNFPKRNGGCIMFNKTCRQYGICHLTSADKVRKFEPDEKEYMFVYNVNDVIQDHVRRVYGKEVEL